jgi:hypothetical protein
MYFKIKQNDLLPRVTRSRDLYGTQPVYYCSTTSRLLHDTPSTRIQLSQNNLALQYLQLFLPIIHGGDGFLSMDIVRNTTLQSFRLNNYATHILFLPLQCFVLDKALLRPTHGVRTKIVVVHLSCLTKEISIQDCGC